MDKEEQSLGGGKELRTLIGNFSAHLEGGGGSDGARPPSPSLPFVSPSRSPCLKPSSSHPHSTTSEHKYLPRDAGSLP